MSEASQFEIALNEVAAPVPERSEAEEVCGLLADHGVDAPRELVLALERLIDRLAFRRAGEALHRLSLRLPSNTVAGIALARVIRGAEEPVRESAKRCKVSHVAILRAEKRIRKHLRLPPGSVVRT